MRGVAELAGVFVTTVSHVINETCPVSDELRRRVLTSMDESGYQPNRLARSPRRGQAHTSWSACAISRGRRIDGSLRPVW
jgi:LacI family transcriptional regulator